MGIERHAKKPVASEGKNLCDKVHPDDTRFGLKLSHKGLPPQKEWLKVRQERENGIIER